LEAELRVASAAQVIGSPAAADRAKRPLTEGVAVVVCTHKRPESLRRFLNTLAAQDRKPEQLIIVDASPGYETEHMVGGYRGFEHLAKQAQYSHVSEPYLGLTRQRNFALRLVSTDLTVFFDDDIVLLPGCLREMERVHRMHGAEVAGVGARTRNTSAQVTWPWRIRMLFRVIPRILPGSYERCGISVPWRFLPDTDRVVEGDFLSGCAMMWKTAVARELGFHEGFKGYAMGEDLDFSLRARRHGKILLAGAALVEHLMDPAGRPDPWRMEYMSVYYGYRVHQRGLMNRGWKDIARFIYAWTVDTLLVARHLVFPSRWSYTARQLAGRFRGAFDLVRRGADS
jgi:GT2 family glycosyltransferase